MVKPSDSGSCGRTPSAVSPPPSPLPPQVRGVLADGVRDGAFPGAVLWVGLGGQARFHGAVGDRCVQPKAAPLQTDTRFDLASLTKPMATMSILMALHDAGGVNLDAPIASQWHNSPCLGGVRDTTPAQLLAHTTGLPAWHPFYADPLPDDIQPGTAAYRRWLCRQICATPSPAPPGSESVYSDLGFILLGEWIAALTHMPLDEAFDHHVARPYGLSHTAFNRDNRPDRWPETTLATTAGPAGDPPTGIVHDHNARAMGGVAGHAGLFADAADVGTWAQILIDGWHGRNGPISAATARRFLRRATTPPGTTWTLGMDTPSGRSSSGTRFGPHTVGHLGFTGTSVWIDLDREWTVVLLTHRVHPHGDNPRIRDIRPRLHDAVAAALWGADSG